MKLKNNWNSLPKATRQEKLEHIDKMSTDLLISAEKKYRKLRTREIHFNLELSKLRLCWRFQRKVVHFRQNQFHDETCIDVNAVTLEITDHYSISIEECTERLKEAKQTYLNQK